MGELAARTANRRSRTGAKTTGATGPGDGASSGVLQLQRSAGNRATAGLLGDDVVQRRRNGKKRKPKRSRAQANTPSTTSPSSQTAPEHTPAPAPSLAESTASDEQTEQQESQGWGAWLGGMATSALGMVGLASADEGDEIAHGEKSEATAGEFTDDHDTPLGRESLLGPPEISITLQKGELKKEVAGAEFEGAYELKRLLDGYEGSAKIEIKRGTERTVSETKYEMLGGMIVSEFTTTEFHGDKAGAKAKGTLSADALALRAEATAFTGFEHKDNAKIKLKIGSEEVATFDGSAGYTVGYGGEAKGHISFDGGKISMGTKGALSYGVGTTWEYKLEIDSPALAKGLWNVLSSWASWLSGVASDLDEALTDEDGDPIRIF